MLQTRQFDVADLQCLEWQIAPPGGTIWFRAVGTKGRLDLNSYGKHDRLRIIRALHELVPQQVQEGWPL